MHAQGLLAPFPRHARPRHDPDELAAMVERIGCLQLDPVPVVARSPLLVAFARVGPFAPAALEEAAYERRTLFDYWAHEASLCHVADLALHRHAMSTWLDREGPRGERWRRFLDGNRAEADALVAEIGARGPVRARELESGLALHWHHGWWTDEISPRQTLARMLDLLWLTGRIGVARRDGQGRLWDLMERCLPDGGRCEALDEAEVGRRAALRAVGMLGVARETHVRAHFTRGRYPQLGRALASLAADGELDRVTVAGLRGEWYARPADLDALPALPAGARTTALSPFDNVLCDRARTAELFGFDHRLEIYVPPAKRRWGYYVLPILHGERFVARADMALDRKAGVLRLLSWHDEPGLRPSRSRAAAVGRALERLAAWLGAAAVARA